MLLFVAPLSEWEMLDDRGDVLGLKGSGSHSIRFPGTRIPAGQTVDASVARDGERTARVFRDMSVAAAHRNLQLRDMFCGAIGRAALGEPQRIPGR